MTFNINFWLMAITEMPTTDKLNFMEFAYTLEIYREIPSQTARSLINNTILICFSPERVQFAGLINLPHSQCMISKPSERTHSHTHKF